MILVRVNNVSKILFAYNIRLRVIINSDKVRKPEPQLIY